MTWFYGVAGGFLVVGMIILLVRVAILDSDLQNLWDTTRLRLERIEEDHRSGLATLRLDLGLNAVSGYCGICLQWTGGDPNRHMSYCRFSHVSAVRDWKRTHPGEPLPEGVEDPDEQQQQGHRRLPEEPA